MTLPTGSPWPSRSLGDLLRLLDLLRRIDLCGEAIIVVLRVFEGLVGLSTLLRSARRSPIAQSVNTAGGDTPRYNGEGHRGSQRQEQVASKRKHGGSPLKSPMLKTILSLGMEILHRPSDLRCGFATPQGVPNLGG